MIAHEDKTTAPPFDMVEERRTAKADSDTPYDRFRRWGAGRICEAGEEFCWETRRSPVRRPEGGGLAPA